LRIYTAVRIRALEKLTSVAPARFFLSARKFYRQSPSTSSAGQGSVRLLSRTPVPRLDCSCFPYLGRPGLPALRHLISGLRDGCSLASVPSLAAPPGITSTPWPPHVRHTSWIRGPTWIWALALFFPLAGLLDLDFPPAPFSFPRPSSHARCRVRKIPGRCGYRRRALGGHSRSQNPALISVMPFYFLYAAFVKHDLQAWFASAVLPGAVARAGFALGFATRSSSAAGFFAETTGLNHLALSPQQRHGFQRVVSIPGPMPRVQKVADRGDGFHRLLQGDGLRLSASILPHSRHDAPSHWWFWAGTSIALQSREWWRPGKKFGRCLSEAGSDFFRLDAASARVVALRRGAHSSTDPVLLGLSVAKYRYAIDAEASLLSVYFALFSEPKYARSPTASVTSHRVEFFPPRT